MNTTEKQPVAEQSSEDKSLDVSDNSANESPATSTNNAENNKLDNKIEIDYLASSLFSNIKEIVILRIISGQQNLFLNPLKLNDMCQAVKIDFQNMLMC